MSLNRADIFERHGLMMKHYSFLFCLLFLSGILDATNASVNSSNLTEEKLMTMMKNYVACRKRCKLQKGKISSAEYKNKKKQCALPLAHVLLEQLNQESHPQ